MEDLIWFRAIFADGTLYEFCVDMNAPLVSTITLERGATRHNGTRMIALEVIDVVHA